MRASWASWARFHRTNAEWSSLALDIASDSYVIMLLADADYAKASLLAQRAGFAPKDVRIFDPNE